MERWMMADASGLKIAHLWIAGLVGLLFGIIITWQVASGLNNARPQVRRGMGFVNGLGVISIHTEDGNSFTYPTQHWQDRAGAWYSNDLNDGCAPVDHKVEVEFGVVSVGHLDQAPGFPEHVVWVRCLSEPTRFQ